MKLKERARTLREQADAATTEAQAKWDVLVTARTALADATVPEGQALTDTPEYVAAQAAKEAYDVAGTAATTAGDGYKAVLELMGTEAPDGAARVHGQHVPDANEAPVSLGAQFTDSDVFRDVSARIPNTPGSKLAIGTTESIQVANREQARSILRSPQGAIFSTPPDVVEPQVQPGIRPLPLLPPLTVLDLITMATTDSTSVKWIREKAFANAAAEVAESAAGYEITKPESTLELEAVNFDVTTVAHWIPASKQSLRDVAGVKSLIDAKLEWGLRRRLAKQVINGDGIGANLKGIVNTVGIGHVDRPASFTAESFMEAIYDGSVTIGDAYGESPNVCFVNRADYKLLRFARDNSGYAVGTGSYIFGSPTRSNPIEVEGTLILPNFDLPADTSIMGVWREFAVWMHEGISIGMSDSHADYYVKNLVAILAEFSAAAGAMETVAFCEIRPTGY